MNRELKSQVIFLSETKIDSSYKDDQFFMRGYNVCRKDRKKGGRGLMAFISTNIASKKVTAPAYKHVEVLSIEIKTTCSTILLVGMYRPPKAVGNDYFSKLEDELSSLCMWAELQKQTVILRFSWEISISIEWTQRKEKANYSLIWKKALILPV